jgi:Chaperone of endosialidase
MNSITRLVAPMVALVLLLATPPSWGQPVCVAPGCNPTVSDANSNTAGGTGALGSLGSPAFANTAFGKSALFGNTAGFSNTAVGVQALTSNTTGNSNTATGGSALANNTSGFQNTASGLSALMHNTTGGFNSASGAYALSENTTGVENTATGAYGLFFNATGNSNTASGSSALALNTTGFGNTAVGRRALLNSTGNKNIGIGYLAGVTLETGHNNIYIGNQGAGDEFQTIRIGTAQTGTFIAGIANAAVGNAASVIIDTTTGQLGVPLSSARYKQDITPMGSRSEKVLDLRPVTFAYKDDTRAITHYGLIAEEVATVYPDLVTRTASGEVQTVKYQELIPMLLNELQRQRHEFQQALQGQQKELAELRALVGQSREMAASAR